MTRIGVRDVLGPGSPLSRTFSSFERRAGQIAMAEAVERALEEERHLFVEAGTGTGKTLAYLLPAVLSGRKVIVSTATRALEEQIFVHDLPIVAQALGAHGVTFRASLMKGLGNYVCLRRFDEARAGDGGRHGLAFERISTWLQTTETGDRAELADLAEEEAAWRDVASSSETRIGATCDYYERCFVTRMRREAEEAQIVVVNHHLFLADLALRTGRHGDRPRAGVLPAYDAVVFDEAHQIEDIATEFFGVRVSSARIDALVRDAERSLAAAGALEALKNGPTRTTLEGIKEGSRAFFVALAASQTQSAHAPRTAYGDARQILLEVPRAVREAHDALDVRLEALEAIGLGRREESLQIIGRRTTELRTDLRGLLAGTHATDDGELSDVVRWVDVRARSVSLGASPVDVGGMLRARLFDRVPTVVCTSATLAAAGGFHFARARLGAPPDTEELVVESPFDFASRAALYVASDLPDPADPGFEEAAAGRVVDLCRMTDGGAFVLCTSTRAMKALHARIQRRLELPVLVQGERPKHVLLSRFRASGRAVLVATMSFWEGVDVPGWALRLVVIDKIPFAPPNDPVVMARCARIDREGGSGFVQYSVPSAGMTLKQGFGRLIRTQRDAGVVALLDRRVMRRGYGRILLAGLPPARRVRDLDDLRAFWDRLTSEFAPEPGQVEADSTSLLHRHTE
ncbi:MAG TPA: ATP-dependent DNA helicase [Polyangiaceae bacterium]|jgi:ATP-dependent DNA helicase DinG